MMALCCDIRGLKMWRGFSLAFENNDADEDVNEDDDEGAAAGHPARSLFEFGASMRDDIASLLGAMVSASSCASSASSTASIEFRFGDGASSAGAPAGGAESSASPRLRLMFFCSAERADGLGTT